MGVEGVPEVFRRSRWWRERARVEDGKGWVLEGTLFAFGLRRVGAESRISPRGCSAGEALELIDAVQREAVALMRFTRSVRTVVTVGSDGAERTSSLAFEPESASRSLLARYDAARPEVLHQERYGFTASDGGSGVVCLRLGGSEAAAQLARDAADWQMRWIPYGGVCLPDPHQGNNHSLYCMLPLPLQTGLPVVVNGFFEISSDRRGVWQPDPSLTGLGKMRVSWNVALCETVIAPAYVEAAGGDMRWWPDVALVTGPLFRCLAVAFYRLQTAVDPAVDILAPPASLPVVEELERLGVKVRRVPDKVVAGFAAAGIEVLLLTPTLAIERLSAAAAAAAAVPTALSVGLIDYLFADIAALARSPLRVLPMRDGSAVPLNTTPLYLATPASHRLLEGAEELWPHTIDASKLGPAAKVALAAMPELDITPDGLIAALSLKSPLQPTTVSLAQAFLCEHRRWWEGGPLVVHTGAIVRALAVAVADGRGVKPAVKRLLHLEHGMLFVDETAHSGAVLDWFVANEALAAPLSLNLSSFDLSLSILPEDRDSARTWLEEEYLHRPDVVPALPLAGQMRVWRVHKHPAVYAHALSGDHALPPASFPADHFSLSGLAFDVQQHSALLPVLARVMPLADAARLAARECRTAEQGFALVEHLVRHATAEEVGPLRDLPFLPLERDGELGCPAQVQLSQRAHLCRATFQIAHPLLRVEGMVLDALLPPITAAVVLAELDSLRDLSLQPTPDPFFFQKRMAAVVPLLYGFLEREQGQCPAVWVWTGTSFERPGDVALSAPEVDPRFGLHSVPGDLRAFEKFLTACGVLARYPVAALVAALERMASAAAAAAAAAQDQQAPAVEAVVSVLAEIVRNPDPLPASFWCMAPADPGTGGFTMHPSRELVYNDVNWEDQTPEAGAVLLVHPLVSNLVAQRVGCRSLRLSMFSAAAAELSHIEAYGQQPESITLRIRSVLDAYVEASTLNELLANADDAGALDFSVCLDLRSFPSRSLLAHTMEPLQQGPSIVVCNSGTFSEADFAALTKVGSGHKRALENVTGKFSLGFLSVYHFTDCPQLLSGDSVVFLDPATLYVPTLSPGKPGLRIKHTPELLSRFDDQFRPLLSHHEAATTAGTVIRLPLRKAPSEISDTVWTKEAALAAVTEFAAKAAEAALFLRRTTRLRVTVIEPSGKVSVLTDIRAHDLVDGSGGGAFQLSTRTVAGTEWTICKRRSDSSTAVALCAGPCPGRLYCTLPMPVLTGLTRVHINARFEVSSNRRNLWSGDPSDERVRANAAIFDEAASLLAHLGLHALDLDEDRLLPELAAALPAAVALLWARPVLKGGAVCPQEAVVADRGQDLLAVACLPGLKAVVCPPAERRLFERFGPRPLTAMTPEVVRAAAALKPPAHPCPSESLLALLELCLADRPAASEFPVLRGVVPLRDGHGDLGPGCPPLFVAGSPSEAAVLEAVPWRVVDTQSSPKARAVGSALVAAGLNVQTLTVSLFSREVAPLVCGEATWDETRRPFFAALWRWLDENIAAVGNLDRSLRLVPCLGGRVGCVGEAIVHPGASPRAGAFFLLVDPSIIGPGLADRLVTLGCLTRELCDNDPPAEALARATREDMLALRALATQPKLPKWMCDAPMFEALGGGTALRAATDEAGWLLPAGVRPEDVPALSAGVFFFSPTAADILARMGARQMGLEDFVVTHLAPVAATMDEQARDRIVLHALSVLGSLPDHLALYPNRSRSEGRLFRADELFAEGAVPDSSLDALGPAGRDRRPHALYARVLAAKVRQRFDADAAAEAATRISTTGDLKALAKLLAVVAAEEPAQAEALRQRLEDIPFLPVLDSSAPFWRPRGTRVPGMEHLFSESSNEFKVLDVKRAGKPGLATSRLGLELPVPLEVLLRQLVASVTAADLKPAMVLYAYIRETGAARPVSTASVLGLGVGGAPVLLPADRVTVAATSPAVPPFCCLLHPAMIEGGFGDLAVLLGCREAPFDQATLAESLSAAMAAGVALEPSEVLQVYEAIVGVGAEEGVDGAPVLPVPDARGVLHPANAVLVNDAQWAAAEHMIFLHPSLVPLAQRLSVRSLRRMLIVSDSSSAALPCPSGAAIAASLAEPSLLFEAGTSALDMAVGGLIEVAASLRASSLSITLDLRAHPGVSVLHPNLGGDLAGPALVCAFSCPTPPTNEQLCLMHVPPRPSAAHRIGGLTPVYRLGALGLVLLPDRLSILDPWGAGGLGSKSYPLSDLAAFKDQLAVFSLVRGPGHTVTMRFPLRAEYQQPEPLAEVEAGLVRLAQGPLQGPGPMGETLKTLQVSALSPAGATRVFLDQHVTSADEDRLWSALHWKTNAVTSLITSLFASKASLKRGVKVSPLTMLVNGATERWVVGLAGGMGPTRDLCPEGLSPIAGVMALVHPPQATTGCLYLGSGACVRSKDTGIPVHVVADLVDSGGAVDDRVSRRWNDLVVEHCAGEAYTALLDSAVKAQHPQRLYSLFPLGTELDKDVLSVAFYDLVLGARGGSPHALFRVAAPTTADPPVYATAFQGNALFRPPALHSKAAAALSHAVGLFDVPPVIVERLVPYNVKVLTPEIARTKVKAVVAQRTVGREALRELLAFCLSDLAVQEAPSPAVVAQAGAHLSGALLLPLANGQVAPVRHSRVLMSSVEALALFPSLAQDSLDVETCIVLEGLGLSDDALATLLGVTRLGPAGLAQCRPPEDVTVAWARGFFGIVRASPLEELERLFPDWRVVPAVAAGDGVDFLPVKAARGLIRSGQGRVGVPEDVIKALLQLGARVMEPSLAEIVPLPSAPPHRWLAAALRPSIAKPPSPGAALKSQQAKLLAAYFLCFGPDEALTPAQVSDLGWLPLFPRPDGSTGPLVHHQGDATGDQLVPHRCVPAMEVFAPPPGDLTYLAPLPAWLPAYRALGVKVMDEADVLVELVLPAVETLPHRRRVLLFERLVAGQPAAAAGSPLERALRECPVVPSSSGVFSRPVDLFDPRVPLFQAVFAGLPALPAGLKGEVLDRVVAMGMNGGAPVTTSAFLACARRVDELATGAQDPEPAGKAALALFTHLSRHAHSLFTGGLAESLSRLRCAPAYAPVASLQDAQALRLVAVRPADGLAPARSHLGFTTTPTLVGSALPAPAFLEPLGVSTARPVARETVLSHLRALPALLEAWPGGEFARIFGARDAVYQKLILHLADWPVTPELSAVPVVPSLSGGRAVAASQVLLGSSWDWALFPFFTQVPEPLRAPCSATLARLGAAESVTPEALVALMDRLAASGKLLSPNELNGVLRVLDLLARISPAGTRCPLPGPDRIVARGRGVAVHPRVPAAFLAAGVAEAVDDPEEARCGVLGEAVPVSALTCKPHPRHIFSRGELVACSGRYAEVVRDDSRTDDMDLLTPLSVSFGPFSVTSVSRAAVECFPDGPLTITITTAASSSGVVVAGASFFAATPAARPSLAESLRELCERADVPLSSEKAALVAECASLRKKLAEADRAKDDAEKKVTLLEDMVMCQICQARMIEAGLACGHCLCSTCAHSSSGRCPFCRLEFDTVTKLYLNV
jgi:hypothetical protein